MRISKAVRRQYALLKELRQRIREDYDVHYWGWDHPGFRAVAVYRFGCWMNDVRPRILRYPLWLLYRFMYRYVRSHYGIDLPRSTKIGRRFYLVHQGTIVIHPQAEIGDDCTILHNVTIGATSQGVPILGNRVNVSCGAVIIGKVTVGDDVRIGPNAVVMTDVPAGSRVVAPPPRIIQLPKFEKGGPEAT